MCACLDAFVNLRACAILVVGVSGSLPIHGIGTASFLTLDSTGKECILRIHNCLLCHHSREDESFNLINVSQLLKTKQSTVSFTHTQSHITLRHKRRKHDIVLNLIHDDGLYALDLVPIQAKDQNMILLYRLM